MVAPWYILGMGETEIVSRPNRREDTEMSTNETTITRPTRKIVAPAAIRNVAKSDPAYLRQSLALVGVEASNRLGKGKLVAMVREQGWGAKGNVVNKAKKQEYGAAQTCGDDVAEVLARTVRTPTEDGGDYLDIEKVREVAKANGISIDRWMHLNIGMIRMNLGNVLRGKVKRGEPVVVGSESWNTEAKAEVA